MPLLAGKLKARRHKKCAAVAGKSTLNRLELSRPQPSLSQDQPRSGGDRGAVRRLVPWRACGPAARRDRARSGRHRRSPARQSGGRFFTAITATCRSRLLRRSFAMRQAAARQHRRRRRRDRGDRAPAARRLAQGAHRAARRTGAGQSRKQPHQPARRFKDFLWELPAQGLGQSRVDARRGQPALRRHLARRRDLAGTEPL